MTSLGGYSSIHHDFYLLCWSKVPKKHLQGYHVKQNHPVRWLLVGACAAAPASLGTESPNQLTCLELFSSYKTLNMTVIVNIKFNAHNFLAIFSQLHQFSFNSEPLLVFFPAISVTLSHFRTSNTHF